MIQLGKVYFIFSKKKILKHIEILINLCKKYLKLFKLLKTFKVLLFRFATISIILVLFKVDIVPISIFVLNLIIWKCCKVDIGLSLIF